MKLATMQFNSMALSIILLITSLSMAFGVAIQDGLSLGTSLDGFEGYAIKPMTFEGTIGGIPVKDEGSIDEIIGRMEVNYPGLTANLTALDVRDEHSSLEARDKKIGILCCPVAGTDWYGATQHTIEDCIKYLNRVTGYCGADAHTCSRRDNHILATCSWIGTFAQDIINKCAHYGDDKDTPNVCGEEFDDENFRVIVRHDDSNGC
ncbi:hypothetical protein BKA61DRAFT_676077 [Leptodontidium sp. MPI-SDFR-AT-0119]|nr:hypothetical protein BKA61DRAFT_676077 [Leptodontidium sp. MPI-SDFR-AT-0119]